MKFAQSIMLSALLLLFGCGTVTPQTSSAISKAFFEGEWYTRAVLVEKNSHSNLAFTGLECPVERIKFRITKNRLLAYRSYHKNDSSQSREKHLVAAFSIKRHVSHDSLFKTWSKADSIEIDWSRNLVPHMECNGWLESITTLHLASAPQNNSEYRLRIGEDYIENTVDALVVPDEKTCNSIEDSTCVGAHYRVKFSFLKIKDRDYEKRHYPDYEPIRYGKNVDGYCLEGDEGCSETKDLWLYSDARRSKICDPTKDNIADCFQPKLKFNAQFGFFRTEIDNYDSRYETNLKGRQQLINRWNIWENNRDKRGALLPLRERVPKKIVYYLNPGFPSELMSAVKRVSMSWNIAIANVVAKIKDRCTLKEANEALIGMNEKVTEKNLRERCDMLFEASKNAPVSEIFFGGKPEEIIAIFGDLFEIRENDCSIDKVNNYLSTHGLSEALTAAGIIFNNNTLGQACAFLEEESQRRALEPFTWQQPGDLRYSFVNGIKNPESAGLLGYGPTAVDPLSGEIIAGTTNIYLAAITEYADASARLIENLEKLESPLENSIKKPSINIGHSLPLHPRETSLLIDNFLKLRATSFVSHFNFKPMEQASNLSEDANHIKDFIRMIAEDPDYDAGSKNLKKANFFSERSACFMHTSSEYPFVRLRDEFKNMPLPEKVEHLKSRITEGVLLHEIGHTLGLRHNFKGTKDPLNYPPNFWGYDSKDYRSRPNLSEEELRSSSIMDYHKNFNSDFSGLGPYDYAALLFGYGEKVEVFDEQSSVPHSLISRLSLMNYRDLPYLFAGDGAEEKIKNLIDEAKNDYYRGDRSAHVDIEKLSLSPHPENLYKRRYIDLHELRTHFFTRYLGQPKASLSVVPYAFCTDSQLGTTDIFCRPFISGASASEVVNDAIDEYKRMRLFLKAALVPEKGVYRYLDQVYGKVYTPILRAYQHYYAFSSDDYAIYPMVEDLKIATGVGLNLISEVLQNVEPGHYCRDSDGNYIPKKGNDCLEEITIDDELGEHYRSTFAQGAFGRPKDIGFIYDKILALLALIDDHARLDHEFAYWQEDNFSIGLYRSFAPALINIFSSLYRDDWQRLAPTLSFGEDKKVSLQYQNLFSTASIGSSTTKIKPSTSELFKDYAILFSMVGLSNLDDPELDFAKMAHISAQSTGSQANASFQDPYTGHHYHALSNGVDGYSLGSLLLKDASAMVHDGQGDLKKAGPWYAARKKVEELNNKFSSVHLMVNEDEAKNSEMALLHAQEIFFQQDLYLREKIRVIEMVNELSNKLMH